MQLKIFSVLIISKIYSSTREDFLRKKKKLAKIPIVEFQAKLDGTQIT